MQKKNNGCRKNFILLIVCLVLSVAVFFAGSAHSSTTHIATPSQNWLQQLQSYLNSHNPTTSKQHATTLTSPSGPCFDQARAAATQAGIDPTLFARQINQESGCTNVTSSAGASGVAQLMPEMAASLNVNTNDTAASLQAGARLMAGYLKTYQGSWALALACYNAGSGETAYVLKTYGNAWYSHLPLETQNYITAITGGQA